MVEVTKVNDSRVKNFISFQSHFLVTLKTSLLLLGWREFPFFGLVLFAPSLKV